MGKQLLALVILMLLGKSILCGQDIVNINIDEQTLEQLMLNTAIQEASNKLHNIQVDSIKKKQSKLMTLVTGIAAEKELLVQTYENVKGFKQESKYYLAMVATGKNIANPTLIPAITYNAIRALSSTLPYSCAMQIKNIATTTKSATANTI